MESDTEMQLKTCCISVFETWIHHHIKQKFVLRNREQFWTKIIFTLQYYSSIHSSATLQTKQLFYHYFPCFSFPVIIEIAGEKCPSPDNPQGKPKLQSWWAGVGITTLRDKGTQGILHCTSKGTMARFLTKGTWLDLLDSNEPPSTFGW